LFEGYLESESAILETQLDYNIPALTLDDSVELVGMDSQCPPLDCMDSGPSIYEFGPISVSESDLGMVQKSLSDFTNRNDA
jgi:hypothetical protein